MCTFICLLSCTDNSDSPSLPPCLGDHTYYHNTCNLGKALRHCAKYLRVPVQTPSSWLSASCPVLTALSCSAISCKAGWRAWLQHTHPFLPHPANCCLRTPIATECLSGLSATPRSTAQLCARFSWREGGGSGGKARRGFSWDPT